MAYDGITMAAVKKELDKSLLGAKVEKIYQPRTLEIVLYLRQNAASYSLICSADSRLARVHLTSNKPENPSTPPSFCMLLRKHLTGARLLSLRQDELERVLIFVFSSYDDFGNSITKSLICEIMGKHSNIILTMPTDNNEPLILGSIKQVTESMSRYRRILPGDIYYPPPTQDKINTFSFKKEELEAALQKTAEDKPASSLVKTVMGVSKDLAEVLIMRAAGGEYCHPLAIISPLTKELHKLAAAITNDKLQPCVYKTASGKLAFSILSPPQAAALELTHYQSVNDCLSAYYHALLSAHETAVLKQKLRQSVNSKLARLEKKLKKQNRELMEMEEADKYRLWGEMLTANLHLLSLGMTEASVPNYYADKVENITIPLDPSCSPQENAQRYFKKYRKLRDGKKYLLGHKAAAEEEIAYLESLLVAIEHADLSALWEIREEMENAGLLRKKKTKKQAKINLSQPMHFVSPDNIDIYVGKNNRQNDQLTFHTAQATDIWLHVKNYPGAHVIIRDANPPADTLLFAAELAAYYSKLSASSNVAVDYTQIRYVKKPRGAKPGMVVYDHHRTVYVTPKLESAVKNKKVFQEN
ncbi:MAG: fibronectin/fibrinogen-binding protein [Firmicutes bacterium]|nr:fibronectin/fibrinogen-binding protein [Bacillota bacterium]